MQAITDILAAYGHDSANDLEPGTHYSIEVPGYEDLVIEKLGEDRLSVAHYYTQMGDLMSDPEVVFRIEGDGWIPVRYTQHPHVHRYDETGLDLDGFLTTWNRNLYEQGFVQAADA